MLDRYTRDVFKTIWSRANIYRTWTKVELAVCRAYMEEGVIGKQAFNTIENRSSLIDWEAEVARVDEIEKTCKHDVIAYLTLLAEKVGDDSRFIHVGMTSSDVLDTSLSLLLVEASDQIIENIKALIVALKVKALQYKDLVCMGRSHGIHGEPITMGLKFLTWYDEMKRNLARFESVRQQLRVGKISGPMGNYVNISPLLEEKALAFLGLKPAPVSTQIISRDNHALFFQTTALVGSSLERFSVEIRHLQRTEVLELEESFDKGQKGSSAMPHKKNPIGSENISGIARILRSNSIAALENIPLWHERDISHSSVERIIAPDSTALLDFILVRFTKMVENLIVYESHVTDNVAKSYYLFFSQTIMLGLTEKGMLREDAYQLVQQVAMQAWDKKKSFVDLVKTNVKIGQLLSATDLEILFDMGKYTKNVDVIFERVLGND